MAAEFHKPGDEAEIIIIKSDNNKEDNKFYLFETDKGLQVYCAISSDVVEHDLAKIDQTKPRNRKPFLCPICGKLVSNVSKHRHREEFHCQICPAMFHTQTLLQQHQNLHLIDHYECKQCPLIFKTLIELALHNYSHTKTYTCPKCETTFKAKSTLQNHVAEEENDFNFTCEICGKGFAVRHFFEAHRDRHDTSNTYKCIICNKQFNLLRYLKDHEKLNHQKELFGNDKLFQCETCSKEFKFERSMKRHMMLMHGVGEKKIVLCGVCGRQFNSHYIKLHMQIHYGEKKFECKICNLKFLRNYYLKRHNLRKHSIAK